MQSGLHSPKRETTHSWARAMLAGEFATVRPNMLQPYGALFATYTWSRSKAEAKQRELIGMTAAVHDTLGGVLETGRRLAQERRRAAEET